MHTCPECGNYCACDGEPSVPIIGAADDCTHCKPFAGSTSWDPVGLEFNPIEEDELEEVLP